MRKTPEQARFERELCARTKELRESLGWSAGEMADMLGIPAERYRKYESRSPMPQYLLPAFSAITQRPLEYILGGAPARQLITGLIRSFEGALAEAADREANGKAEEATRLLLNLLKGMPTGRPKIRPK